MKTILSAVEKIIFDGITAEVKRQTVTKWYFKILKLFGEDTIVRYKDEFSTSLNSQQYSLKVQDLAVLYEIALPKIPLINDFLIAKMLINKNKLTSLEINILKKITNYSI
tara:strand:- start:457 stop:786 length:330 start_codon:yes stop_codon:yes gene_type:complete